jgi:type III secretion protein N (ATPase)
VWRDAADTCIVAAEAALRTVGLVAPLGRVQRVLGTLVEGTVPHASIGEQCELFHRDRPNDVRRCEVVGFTEETTLLSPMEPLEGVSAAYMIRPLRTVHRVAVSEGMLGRVLDGFGNPLDGKPPPDSSGPDTVWRNVIAPAMTPGERPRISEVFPTGIRAIDGPLALGKGQRVGIFASPGAGKTSLMAAMARGSQADVLVLALIGERGREVREFTEHELDADLLQRTVIVCATSDRTSIERVRAAFTATAIAEGLRDHGLNVLLMVDSLTRLARAQREIGLAAGEVPARAGFPPSVYALLPRLLERAGNAGHGCITAVYTVLLEGEIKSDPISEEAVSLLDGHILLSRKLAEQGHYPAVDILPSISRIMSNITPAAHVKAAARMRQILTTYRDLELLIRLGEYKAGMDLEADKAVQAYPKVMAFLKQDTRTSVDVSESIEQLQDIAENSL